MDNGKIYRVLCIYTKLMGGYLVTKAEEAQNHGVNERTIQRDIDDIRNFMDSDIENTGVINSVVYDHRDKGYRLERVYQLKLTNGEILAICKILLESRALRKEEMSEILEKLISCCVPEKNQKLMKELIRNEEFHYVEPRHKSKFLDIMWEIGQAIRNCQCIVIDYMRTKDKTVVKRKVKPVAIMFSEYYFYLTAFIEDIDKKQFEVADDPFPTIYRIDRIEKVNITKDHFKIPYRDRFEEGEFRKRVQFMYGGKLQRVRFRYKGTSAESVLDRLPTAKILKRDGEGFVISAEVFGKGIEMWLRSQGEMVEVLDGAK